MPNIINATGVQIKELQDIILDLKEKMRVVFGEDINLDPETPDAQLVTIFSQAIRDIEEIILDVNATFDPDQAYGRLLDIRVALNGIQRQGGTYSITNVDITVNRAIELYGDSDTTGGQKFIIEDNSGTKWILRNNANLVSGTTSLSFRAALPGQVLSQPGTIQTPVTIINGVTGVNNSEPQTTIGDNEESDRALKERRRQSVSLSSQGYRAGLLATLKNIPGMIDAYVYENRTSQNPDTQGLPAHSIWVVTDGNAPDEDIAVSIYRKRNAGCNLKEGTKAYLVPEIDGEIFRATWDEVEIGPLFVKFKVTPLNPSSPVSIDVIKERLPQVFRPGVGGQVNINELAAAVQSIDSNALVQDAGFSATTLGVYTPVLSPSLNERFGLIKQNIIITPIEIIPRINNVSIDQEITFQANGGLAPFTWSIESGTGTINSTTGVFTSSSVNTVTIKVVDSIANESFKIIQVV